MPIHSDWGDWLPRAVADADPGGLALWYLGCNGFVVKAEDGTTLFVDPYLGTGDPPRTLRMLPVPFHPEDVREADAVLATHEHSDHVHGPSQGPILRETGADFVGPHASVTATQEAEWVGDYDLGAEQFQTIAPGETLEYGSITVHVEPAYDPDATEPVSYAIEHEAGTFFHGGDTKPTQEFEVVAKRRDVDLAALAYGSAGTIPDKETREPQYTEWYMDENQLIETANTLEADRLLPTHWDMWKRLTADPTSLHYHADGFEYPRRLEVATIGDRLDVDP
jgi:L-ascorbate 6-phosphate lactonase